MNPNKRSKKILKLFQRVDESGLSAKKYFKTHKMPISVSQYFRLKQRCLKQGVMGLEDQRHAGNARKLSVQQIELSRGTLAYNRQLTTKSLRDELYNQWEIELERSRIDQLRQQFNLTRIKTKTIKQVADSESL